MGIPDPTNKGRLVATNSFDAVMKRLEKSFVHLHLGPNAFSPSKAKTHNTAYSKIFFWGLGDDHLGWYVPVHSKIE